jgi:hypothetical protein
MKATIGMSCAHCQIYNAKIDGIGRPLRHSEKSRVADVAVLCTKLTVAHSEAFENDFK